MPRNITRRDFSFGVASLGGSFFCPPAIAQTKCAFTPLEPTIRLLLDGRNVELVARYLYTDSSGRPWPVPTHTVVDGASIPQVFWGLIGGPFEGRYRGPSIVHDFYCDKRSRKAAEVHSMFHEAMLCAGVGSRKAFIMYEAVRRFGPTWTDPKPRPPQCDVATDDYDFDHCTTNAAIPQKRTPRLGRNELEQFIDDVKDNSDQQDIDVLKRQLQKM